MVGFPKHRAWTDPGCYAEGTSVARPYSIRFKAKLGSGTTTSVSPNFGSLLKLATED